MSEENRPAASAIEDNPPPQTVWLRDDPAIQRLGDNPPESHWSRRNTQPLGPRWPTQVRQRLAAQRAAVLAHRQSHALGMGAGVGALLTLLVLCLVLVLAINNGWLSGSSAASPDSSQQWPIPVQPTPRTPIPNATNMPTSTALPGATVTTIAQPTTTAEPTATAQPTATATPKPTPRPTRTPSP